MPTGPRRNDLPDPRPGPVAVVRREPHPHRAAGVAGICHDSLMRLDRALAGVDFPADKWELIAHAERHAPDQPRLELRTIRMLWALPAGRYADFSQVIAGAARTVRGHPRRDGRAPARREAGAQQRGGCQIHGVVDLQDAQLESWLEYVDFMPAGRGVPVGVTRGGAGGGRGGDGAARDATGPDLPRTR